MTLTHCKRYITTDTRFCQAFFNTKTPIWIKSVFSTCETHVNCISLSGISRAWKLICARELRGLWPLPDHVFRAENRTSFFSGCDVAGYYVQKMSTYRGSDACKTKSWFVRVKVGLNLHLVLQSTPGACQRGVRFIVHPSVYNWVWEFLNWQSEPHIFWV